MYAFYFKNQDDFMRPLNTNLLYLQRSLEIILFDKIKVCVKLKIMEYHKVTILSEDEQKSEETAGFSVEKNVLIMLMTSNGKVFIEINLKSEHYL